MSDIVKLDISTMEMTINGNRVGKCYGKPSYEMNEDLDDLYIKITRYFADNNAETIEEQNAILDVIKQIINDEDMSFALKLFNIQRFLRRIKDWYDNEDIIISQAISSEKEQ